MRIYLKNIRHYFLTVDTNGVRKQHIMDEFKDYNPTEVNPILGIGKYKSGASGFSKMIDLGLRNQDRGLPFQPFVMYEDDSSKFGEFPEYIDVPDDADMCYTGLSICSMNEHKDHHGIYYKNINTDIIRIYNMLATHSIMICSAAGALAIQKAVFESYNKNIPWDIPLAYIQPYYNVYALKVPLVFQDGAYGGFQSETKITITANSDSDIPKKYINTTNDSIILCYKPEIHYSAFI
jgi:hypothetical protein